MTAQWYNNKISSHTHEHNHTIIYQDSDITCEQHTVVFEYGGNTRL